MAMRLSAANARFVMIAGMASAAPAAPASCNTVRRVVFMANSSLPIPVDVHPDRPLPVPPSTALCGGSDLLGNGRDPYIEPGILHHRQRRLADPVIRHQHGDARQRAH